MRWQDYEYEIIGDRVQITRYEPESDADAVCIPSYIDELPVGEIGAGAFSEGGAFLSRVEIPPTVRRIGEGAFRMCLNLSELILHEGLEEIGAGALFLTPLTEVALPDSVRVIECPWDLGSIRFTMTENSLYFYSDGFCLFRRDVGAKRELLVSLQDDGREEYEIPEGTTRIGENAFTSNGHLRRVTIPGTVRSIGEAAFEGCQNLAEITLSEGLREIGANAFGHCIRLKSLHIPSTVETIGESALSDTFGWSESFLGLERITVEPGNPHFSADADALFEADESGQRFIVKYFGDGGSYRIPWDVSCILPGAFRRAKFYRCEIPMSVRSVGKDAFRECKNLEGICLKETGTDLYIPGQPIYRKDEVTALLRAERPEGGTLFDYPGYDALFETYLNLPDRCGMACCRLKYPVQLSEERAAFYRDFLEKNLTGILQGIAQKQDMEQLVMLAGLGLFTEENLEIGLDVFAASGQTKMTAYLLNYGREHGEGGGFDFSF